MAKFSTSIQAILLHSDTSAWHTHTWTLRDGNSAHVSSSLLKFVHSKSSETAIKTLDIKVHLQRRHISQHNDIRHNDTQHKGLINDTEHSQHNNALLLYNKMSFFVLKID